MSESFWILPGPAAFVERLRGEITMGRSVVVGIPSHGPRDLSSAMRRVVSNAWQWIDVAAQAEGSPLRQVVAGLGLDYASLSSHSAAGLVDIERFRGVLVWVRAISEDGWPRWRQFLTDYEVASRKLAAHDRSVIVVQLDGELAAEVVPDEVALTSMSWRDVVGELDMLLYASQTLRGTESNPRKRSLLAFCVTRIAMWDRDTADRLLEARQEDIIAPGAVLNEIMRDRGWTTDVDCSWTSGTEDLFDGLPYRHSAHCTLDRSGAMDIDRRLWAAQAAVLLPLIEERRVELIQKARRHLQMPVVTREGQIDRPGDLEIGTLHYLLFRSRAEARFKSRVDRIRRIRNKLAHLVPLEITLALHDDLYDSVN